VWTAPTLASGLFVLAALFVRAAALLTALAFAILAATGAAGRLVILRIAAWCLMSTALLTFVHAALLSLLLISVVWHFYSSLG
jgi:hypothetical protein